ncbi:MAG TPA: glycerophosphodiester phosphodiesterase [Anaeromyxobacter sp.]|nr:glycerophosphodiester phosphodiesterase [Anaeromyxobacter sp.]
MGARHPYLDLPGPWLVAHRGGSLLAPENTLPAFDRAAALGADALEIDVRRTADGAVVVFHDEETARLTGAPGTIEARTLAEVKALDAGHSFTPDGGASFPFRGRGVAVPRLSEVLARHPRLRLNIDAKPDDPALAEALALELRAAGALERVCVGSFFDAQAERLGALLPGCARYLPERAATCHVMAAKSGADGAACPGGYQLADLPHRLGDLEVVDRAVVSYLHARGIPVHVWTVDDEAEMRELLALGVDGIVTDRPDLLARVLGR